MNIFLFPFSLLSMLMALLPSAFLFSQQSDIRISPADTAVYPFPGSAMIQSADRIGDRTLVVWGGTASDGAGSVRAVLWGAIVQGNDILEMPSLLTGEEARPGGVVSALRLDDRFVVLWNDLRAPDSGIYMQRLDMAGKPIGTAQRLAGPAALRSDADVWSLRDSIGYSIIWSEAVAGDLPAYFRQRLDPSGLPSGVRERIPAPNFGAEVRYDDLPGAVIVQGDPVRWRYPDGRFDERSLPAERFTLPHYLAADTSFALLRWGTGDSLFLEYYENLFDAGPARRIPVPRFEGRIEGIGAVGRDSSGNYRIILLVEERAELQKLISLYSTTLNGAGEFSAPVRMSVVDYGPHYTGGSYTFTAIFSAFRYHGGNDNVHRITFHGAFTQTGRAGNPAHNSSSRDDTVFLDRYGNIVDRDAVKPSTVLGDLRSRPELQRVAGYGSSVVLLEPGTIGVTLAVPLAALINNLPQTVPALALAGGEIIAIWNQPEKWPLFHQAKLFARPGVDVTPLPAFIPDSRVPSKSDRDEYKSAGAVIPLAGGGLVGFESVRRIKQDPVRWIPMFRFNIYPPTDSGWNSSAIGYAYANASSPMQDARYTYDPNTRLTLGCFTSNSNGKGGRRIVVWGNDGHVLWDTIHIHPAVGNLIARGERNYINIHSDEAFGMDGKSLFSLERSVATADARYGRSLGEYFFRYYPVVPADSGGRMKEPEVQFERYDFSGNPAGSVRIAASGGYFDPVIVPRPADSSLYVLWPGDSGVWLTVIASDLKRASSPERVTATSGRVKGVAGIFRNDSLFLVWEDYRNGASDIYGTVHLPSSLSDGPTPPPDNPVVPGAVTFALYPIPAERQVNILVDMADADGLRMEVADMAGRIVASRNLIHAGGGARTFTLDVGTFPPGAYFLTLLRDDGTRNQGRFIVQ